MHHFIVLYGGAVNKEGGLNEDSAGRCEKALEVARGTENATIIFSVDETIPALRHTTLFYLTDSGWPLEKIIALPEAHNTFGETRSALRILRKFSASEVIVVSSWYHMLRICLMWRALGFHGKIDTQMSSETAHPLRSLLWEIAGFVKFFYRFSFHKS